MTSGVAEKTVDVRDTSELYLLRYRNDQILMTSPSRSTNTNMDPRRARDPRLAARADLRLQQPQPHQQQLHQQLPTSFPNNGVNSNPGSHSVTPPQPFVSAMATVSSQIPTAADASTSALTQPMDLHSPASLKTRPLFCVVCASNQVSGSNISA